MRCKDCRYWQPTWDDHSKDRNGECCINPEKRLRSKMDVACARIVSKKDPKERVK